MTKQNLTVTFHWYKKQLKNCINPKDDQLCPWCSLYKHAVTEPIPGLLLSSSSWYQITITVHIQWWQLLGFRTFNAWGQKWLESERLNGEQNERERNGWVGELTGKIIFHTFKYTTHFCICTRKHWWGEIMSTVPTNSNTHTHIPY